MNPTVSTAWSKFISTKEAARLLGISHRTLEKWRLEQKGPAFLRLGRLVRYDLEAILALAP